MKKGDILIAPEGCEDWFTPFMEYVVQGFWSRWTEKHGHRVSLIDDHAELTDCLEKGCSHLKEQDWIIKTEAEKEWNKLNKKTNLSIEQSVRLEYLSKVLKKE